MLSRKAIRSKLEKDYPKIPKKFEKYIPKGIKLDYERFNVHKLSYLIHYYVTEKTVPLIHIVGMKKYKDFHEFVEFARNKIHGFNSETDERVIVGFLRCFPLETRTFQFLCEIVREDLDKDEEDAIVKCIWRYDQLFPITTGNRQFFKLKLTYLETFLSKPIKNYSKLKAVFENFVEESEEYKGKFLRFLSRCLDWTNETVKSVFIKYSELVLYYKLEINLFGKFFEYDPNINFKTIVTKTFKKIKSIEESRENSRMKIRMNHPSDFESFTSFTIFINHIFKHFNSKRQVANFYATLIRTELPIFIKIDQNGNWTYSE